MRISGNIRTTIKSRQRLLVVVTISAIFISTITGLLLYFGNTESSIGAEKDDPINPGKIITQFNWKNDDPLKADIGESAISINKDVSAGHTADPIYGGLAPASTAKDIRLVLKANDQYNSSGIDISINFRTDEIPGGSFYSRGSYFNFGIRKGALAVTYTLKNVEGKERTFTEISNYEIPLDSKFRAYRFLYTEWSGKLELFVNNVNVWSKQHAPGQNLVWKNSEDIVIGRNIYGLRNGGAVLDDLVIKSTYKQQDLPMSLLGFLTEIEDLQVKLTWITRSESDNKGFTIERSIDAVTFTQIGFVKGAGNSNVVQVYTFNDLKPISGLAYYRLKPLNYSGDNAVLPLVAQKYKSDDKQKASIKSKVTNP